jgi:hypothetical protein
MDIIKAITNYKDFHKQINIVFKEKIVKKLMISNHYKNR